MHTLPTNSLHGTFGLLIATAFATSASAAVITYGSAQDISADTDVINTDVIYAVSLGTSAAQTVNGVSFADSASTDITVADFGGGIGEGFGALIAGSAFSTLTPGFQGVLRSGIFSPSATAEVTLNGLTPGTNYQVQIFTARTDANVREYTFADGTSSVTLNSGVDAGQFAIGTFTADAATQSLGIITDDSNFGVFSAVVVAEAVPEPSSMALLALGGLGLLRRRR